MRERKKKHDDAHYPLQGKGKRSVKKTFERKACEFCGSINDLHLSVSHDKNK